MRLSSPYFFTSPHLLPLIFICPFFMQVQEADRPAAGTRGGCGRSRPPQPPPPASEAVPEASPRPSSASEGTGGFGPCHRRPSRREPGASTVAGLWGGAGSLNRRNCWTPRREQYDSGPITAGLEKGGGGLRPPPTSAYVKGVGSVGHRGSSRSFF
jgi:hypothetical protein